MAATWESGPGPRVVDAAGAVDLTDGELLERFAIRHEEGAFAELLHRHGPMVLGVCRRILGNTHDADDAFQATFLVLVRKAASITKRPSVGSWLYGVAYRIARKAKRREHQRRAHERQAVSRSIADPYEEILWRDLRPVLDEEVNRLPEKYRAPLVLCFLEGRAYAEAARQIGCSKGTIALRLAQAREMLRHRLTRRGVVLSVAVLAALLAQDKALVPVPDPLRTAATKAALLWVTRDEAAGVVPASVATLAQTTLSALMWARLRVGVAMVAALGLASGIAGVALHRMLAESPAAVESDSVISKKGEKMAADRSDRLLPGIRRAR